jgi:hypothetical protein
MLGILSIIFLCLFVGAINDDTGKSRRYSSRGTVKYNNPPVPKKSR